MIDFFIASPLFCFAVWCPLYLISYFLSYHFISYLSLSCVSSSSRQQIFVGSRYRSCLTSCSGDRLQEVAGRYTDPSSKHNTTLSHEFNVENEDRQQLKKIYYCECQWDVEHQQQFRQMFQCRARNQSAHTNLIITIWWSSWNEIRHCKDVVRTICHDL